jgi:four helix bundle protein
LQEGRGWRAKAKAKGNLNREGEVRGSEGVEGGGRWGKYDPERLAVYRLAREHTRRVNVLIRTCDTRGFADLVDDLRRCCKSLTANVKEGYGEHRPAKKANFYSIAKASATEGWGHIDSFVDFGLVTSRDIAPIRDLQNQIIALLVTMIRTQQSKIDRR